MAIKLADVFLAISADDKSLDSDLNRVEGKTQSWASGMAGNVAKFAGGIAIGAATAAGAAIVGLAKTGIDAFVGFERQMNEVFTLLPGITDEAMSQMNEQVKTFAKEFGVLPEEVVPALYQALSAGVPPDNVFDFLAVANKAAVGGVAELETAVDGISSVVNAYGSDIVDATKASDLMFTAVRLGKTDFNQLSASLFQVIPTAASLGVEFGDVTAALAAMTAQGTPTSVATTQLRQLLVELSKDGGKAANAFEELSGKSFVDFVAEGGNVQDALIVMERAAEKNNVRLSDMFGSVEAGNAALALTGKGADTFRGNLLEMANATGATEAAFQQMDTGIGKSMEKISAAWSVAMLDVGNAIAPLVNMVLPHFTTAVQNIIPYIVGFFEGLATLVGWFNRSEESGRSLGSFFENLPAPLQNIVNAFQTLSSMLQGQLSQALSGTTGLFAYFATFVEENMPRIQQIVETVLGAIATFWQAHGETIMQIVTNTFNTAFTIIDTVLRTVMDVVTLVLQLITGDFEGAGQTLIDIVTRIWETILTVANNQLESLRLLFGSIDFAAAGQAVIDGVWNGMQNAWGRVSDWFTRRLNELRNMLPFSEPKDPSSPLRNLKKSGAAIVEQLQLGIDSAALSIGEPDFSGMAVAGNGVGAVTNNNGGNVSFAAGAFQIHVGGGATQEAGREIGAGILDVLRSRGLA